MPVVYRIDATRGVIYTRCIGQVTLNEVLSHLRELAQDPACPDRLHVLLDLSECTSIPESGQLQDITGQIGKVSSRVRFGRCAIVAPTDVLFGMSRMFGVFAEGWFQEVGVFRTREEVGLWPESAG
ncbi:MAG: STAS/SEC14 domain-containing protein [Bryobacteraceae bacterium]